MQRIPGKALTYRSDIDGLRAIAVLSVFAFHVSPGRVKGGFVGVDIFFVISGFLISSIIYKDLESNAFSIIEFYVRRIRRIYPALFIVLAAVCVAGWFFLLPTSFVRLGEQIIGGSTFVANFVLWEQSGYFSPNVAKVPLLHLWSLGVEEQFYLMFPLICAAFYRSKSRTTLPVAFLVIALLSMTLNVATVTRHGSAAFFLPYSRLWELFVGAGLALGLQRNLETQWEGLLLEKWQTAIGILGLALILVSVFCIDEYDPFPGWWGLLPTMGAALVIAAGPSAWCNRHILSSKPAVFLGLISYPLYLWHWPILSFMKVAPAFFGIADSHLLKTVLIVLCFVLAYLTYRYIELPIRRVKERGKRRRGAFWLLGSVTLTGAFGLLVVLTGGFPSRVPRAVAALDHDFDASASSLSPQQHCFLLPDQLADSFSDSCANITGTDAAHPLVLVWGDSHASDLIPGFRSMQPQSGIRFAQYTASLCAPIVGIRLRERQGCLPINNAIVDRVLKLKPEIVVLSAIWDRYLDYDSAARAEKLLETIKMIRAGGIRRVVIIGSAPEWTDAVPELLINELHRHPNSPVPHGLSRSLLKPHDDTLLKATTEKAGAVYLPLFEDLCDQTSCIATTGPGWQDIVTMDSAHFTEHGSILVAQRIWTSILQSGD